MSSNKTKQQKVNVRRAFWSRAALALAAWIGLAAMPAFAQSANDNFANAQVITGSSGTTAGNNFLATREPGEPGHHISPSVPTDTSVWFAWTAPSNGTA